MGEPLGGSYQIVSFLWRSARPVCYHRPSPGTEDKPGLNFTPEQMIHLLDMEEKACVTVDLDPQTPAWTPPGGVDCDLGG